MAPASVWRRGGRLTAGTTTDGGAMSGYENECEMWDAIVQQDARTPDPEYADVDEEGQLALGVPGEQRTIPGLAAVRDTDDS